MPINPLRLGQQKKISGTILFGVLPLISVAIGFLWSGVLSLDFILNPAGYPIMSTLLIIAWAITMGYSTGRIMDKTAVVAVVFSWVIFALSAGLGVLFYNSSTDISNLGSYIIDMRILLGIIISVLMTLVRK